MKKLFASVFALVAFAAMPVVAQDVTESTSDDTAKDLAKVEAAQAPREKASWPVWLAFNSTENIDVIGLRLTLPYGKCEHVTGFDLGIFGRCQYFHGFAVNILRNHVIDYGAGVQIGVYNTIGGRDDTLSWQIGLWNESNHFSGLQTGLVNLCDSGTGVQIGIINRAECFYGYQIGVVNVIRGTDVPFMPILNIGF